MGATLDVIVKRASSDDIELFNDDVGLTLQGQIVPVDSFNWDVSLNGEQVFSGNTFRESISRIFDSDLSIQEHLKYTNLSWDLNSSLSREKIVEAVSEFYNALKQSDHPAGMFESRPYYQEFPFAKEFFNPKYGRFGKGLKKEDIVINYKPAGHLALLPLLKDGIQNHRAELMLESAETLALAFRDVRLLVKFGDEYHAPSLEVISRHDIPSPVRDLMHKTLGVSVGKEKLGYALNTLYNNDHPSIAETLDEFDGLENSGVSITPSLSFRKNPKFEAKLDKQGLFIGKHELIDYSDTEKTGYTYIAWNADSSLSRADIIKQLANFYSHRPDNFVKPGKLSRLSDVLDRKMNRVSEILAFEDSPEFHSSSRDYHAFSFVKKFETSEEFSGGLNGNLGIVLRYKPRNSESYVSEQVPITYLADGAANLLSNPHIDKLESIAIAFNDGAMLVKFSAGENSESAPSMQIVSCENLSRRTMDMMLRTSPVKIRKDKLFTALNAAYSSTYFPDLYSRTG